MLSLLELRACNLQYPTATCQAFSGVEPAKDELWADRDFVLAAVKRLKGSKR